MGRRLPVNIWTWAGSGAGVERSQGSQAGEVSAPPDTGLGRLSMCSPPHHRIRQWLKPEQMPGKGVSRPFPAPRTRAGFKQGGLWQFLPRVPGTEGGDRGAKNRERKEGKSSPGGGAGRERGPLAPIFLRSWGKQSQRWPWRWGTVRAWVGRQPGCASPPTPLDNDPLLFLIHLLPGTQWLPRSQGLLLGYMREGDVREGSLSHWQNLPHLPQGRWGRRQPRTLR